MSGFDRESDLYPPVRAFFEARGLTVRGEVRGCDLAAVDSEGRLVAVELKLRCTLLLLLQAAERQRSADAVYVALPAAAAGRFPRRWRKIERLLKRLELGLLLVNNGPAGPRAELAFHPVPYRPRRENRERAALLREVHARTGDFNAGGSVGGKLVTAYREEALLIALLLERHGPSAPKELRARGAGKRTQPILYNNVYGWFERIAPAQYALSSEGSRALAHYADIVDAIRRRFPSE